MVLYYNCVTNEEILKKTYDDKNGDEKVLEQEFIWYETTGEYTRVFANYKRERKMREEMAKYNFFME